MSYDDDKFGTIFPRRTGVPTGHANERAMLDAMGGSDSFRKRFRNNVDGSVTRLDTKNGQPQFSNEGPATQVRTDIYMESGQLNWNYPAPEAPDRLDPAQWHFLNIPTADPFLGRIVSTTGAQKNATALAEGQDSLAIGYPRSTDPSVDATRKDDYGNSTLSKKTTASWFPPSIYSGKMRLFLQAQYGAAETKTPPPLQIDLAGASPVLNYVRNGTTLTLGLWPHNSVGILTDANGYFWLVSITNRTGSEYVVTVYPITAGANVKALATYLRANRATLDAATIAKLEAYIFSGSVIETTRPTVAGTFSAVSGGTLCYGWKWNSSGSEASIVVHELLGTGAADYRWKARTIQVSISSSGSGSAQTFDISSSTSAGAEWTDGWSTFNIFVPDSETSTAPLSLFSLKLDPMTYLPDFDFTNVPVYGYYVGDVWTPVLMSRSVMTGPFPTHEWSSTNITYPPDVIDGTYYANRHTLGDVLGDQGCTYYELNITDGTNMSVTVDGHSYAGRFYNGTRVIFDKTSTLTGTTADNTVAFTGAWVGGAPHGVGAPPGFAGGGGAADGANHGGFVRVTQTVNTTHNTSGTMYEAWVLVIPGGDSEAAYVATHTFDGAVTNSTTIRTGTGVGRFFSVASAYDFAPWSSPNTSNEFFGNYGPPDVVVTSSDPPPDTQTYVYCFNQAVHGTQGTPGGSYYTLFNVDRSYPYYDRGMYTYTSNGLRYVMSEGLIDPASVNYGARFVGWA